MNHTAGFFSCCAVKLRELIRFMNENKTIPDIIDSLNLFSYYKNNAFDDVSYDYFEDYNNNIIIHYKTKITYDHDYQFVNYKTLNYSELIPFINKYFRPSAKIINIQNDLICKYNIEPSNCIALYYRGTDKISETKIDSFESYYEKLNELIVDNTSMQILIQTDSGPFLDYMKENCKNSNIIIINENDTSYGSSGIHLIQNKNKNHIDMQYLFATFLIISKCKHIICSSSNGAVWMMYYRGHADNVYQNLDLKWL